MHKECFPQHGWKVLRSLRSIVLKYDAVLAGGTALALHLGHRISVDLDFFTEKEVRPDSLVKEFIDTGLSLQVLSEGEGYLVAIVDGIKFSMFHYDYPFTAPLIYKGAQVAGILDIAAMKIIAISQRGTKRDFVDMYFILRDIPFHKVAEHLVRRFGRERINPVHIGKSLVYFADADPNYDPDFIGEKVSWEAIKIFFKRHARQFTLDLDAAKGNTSV